MECNVYICAGDENTLKREIKKVLSSGISFNNKIGTITTLIADFRGYLTPRNTLQYKTLERQVRRIMEDDMTQELVPFAKKK